MGSDPGTCDGARWFSFELLCSLALGLARDPVRTTLAARSIARRNWTRQGYPQPLRLQVFGIMRAAARLAGVRTSRARCATLRAAHRLHHHAAAASFLGRPRLR